MQKEAENFLRIAILIIQYIKASLISLVDLDLKNKALTFEHFINQHQHDIYHLCFNKSKCCQCPPGRFNQKFNRQLLHQPQLKDLFDDTNRLPGHVPRSYPTYCCCNAIKGISTKNLDVTLARTLLVNFCKDVFWFSCTTAKHQTLEDFLNQNKHVIYHLWRYNMTCCQCPPGFQFPSDTQLMDQAQWNAIFTALSLPCIQDRKRPYSGSGSVCSVSATPGIQLQHLNASLQDAIIKFCCPLKKTIDIFIEMRNIRYAHIKDASIPDNEYTIFKTDIENGILEIASITGNESEMKHVLQELEQRTLDETLCLQYQTSLLSLIGEKEDLKSDLRETSAEYAHVIVAIIKCIKDIASLQTALEAHAKDMSQVTSGLQNRLSSLEKSVEAIKETSMRSKLIEHTDQELKEHIEDKTFVETKAIQRFMKIYGESNTFLITGRAGMGKSRNGLEILRQLGNRYKDHDLVKITELGQIVEVLANDKKMVLLLEDVFGKTNCKYNEDNDSHLLDKIHSYINSGKVNVIFTIRTSVRKSLQYMYLFSSHKLFQGFWEIDLNSIEFQMTTREKEQLISNYFEKNNIKIVGQFAIENLEDENIIDKRVKVTMHQASVWEIVHTETFLGFPQACFLFTSNRLFTRLGVKFFKHPTGFLNNEIDNLRIRGQTHEHDRMLYVTLVYILLCENRLKKIKFDTEKASKILRSCFGRSELVIESRVHDAADEMVGGYLKYDSETSEYQFQHQTIYESVLLSYNKVDPKQVLGMIDFDMIRELVRLQVYKKKREEIIMIVPEQLYSRLSRRLVDIFVTRYKQTPQDFIKLLCECEIMRRCDHAFIYHLNASFNDIVPKCEIKTLITYEGKSEMVVCNILAALLWHMTLHNWPTRNVQIVLEILKDELRVENKKIIVNGCHETIVAAFTFSCGNETALDKLDAFLNCIKEVGIFLDINDNFRQALHENNSSLSSWLLLNLSNRINIVECILELDTHGLRHLVQILSSILRCAPCDIFEREKTIQWVFANSEPDQFDITEAICTICLRKQTRILKWILGRISHCKQDVIKLLMEQACKNGWEQVVIWLLTNNDLKHFDLKAVMFSACEKCFVDVVKMLLTKTNTQYIDLENAMKVACKNKQFGIISCVLANVDHNSNDIKAILTTATNEYRHDFELLDFFHSLSDWLLTQSIKHYDKTNRNYTPDSLIAVKWLLENNITGKCHNDLSLEILDILLKRIEYLEHVLKWLLLNIDIQCIDISLVMLDLCRQRKSRTVEWLIQHVDCKLLNLGNNLNESCQFRRFDIVKCLVNNAEHQLFNFTEAFCTLIKEEWKTQRNEHLTIMKWLIQNVKHDFFDVEKLFDESLTKNCTGVTKLISGNFHVDCWKLGIQSAMDKLLNRECRALNARNQEMNLLLKDIGSKTIELCNVEHIMEYACCHGWLEIVKWLVTNIDHRKLGIQSAMHELLTSFYLEDDERDFKVTNLLFEEIGAEIVELCDVDHIMKYACCHGWLEIVEWLVTNIDHRKLGIQSAMHELLKNIYDEDDLGFKVTNLLLEEIGAEIVELCDVDDIMQYACCHGWQEIVKWLVTNIDHRKLGIQSAMNELLISSYHEDDERRFELTSLLLEEIGAEIVELCDVDHIMQYACRHGWQEIVKWLVTNIDHRKLGIQFAIYELLTCSHHEDDERGLEITNLLLEEIGAEIVELCDVEDIMKYACCHGWIEIVDWLVTNIDHRKLGIQSTMDELLTSFVHEDEWGFEVTNLLLEEIGAEIVELCDVNFIMEYACCHGWQEIVKWLVINIDHMNVVIKSLMDRLLNADADLSYLCNRILQNLLLSIGVNIAEWYNVQDIMKYACCNGFVNIVEWLLTNCAQHINISITVQNAFYNSENTPREDIIEYFLDNVDHSLLDMIYIMNESCHFGLSQIVKWLLEHKDKSMFDMKKVFEQACYHNDLNLVKYIYENNTTEQFDFRRAMNKACRCNKWYMFNEKLDTVKWLWENCDHKYFDMECAMNNACRYGNIRIMKWISDIVDTTAFKMNIILNNACRHGQSEIAEWIVKTIELGRLDFQQAAMETCLCQEEDEDILEVIVNINNRPLLDFNRIIDEACKHGKTYIVEMLLEYTDCNDILDLMKTMKSVLAIDAHVNTTDSRQISLNVSEKQRLALAVLKRGQVSIDLNEVFLKSCSNGWLEIIEWLWTNVNKDLLDVRSGINLSCKYVRHDVVRWALQNVNINKLDLKTIMIESCGCGWYDHVQWLWKNDQIDNTIFDMKSAVDEACTFARFDVLKWIVDTVEIDRYDITTVMYTCCKNGWLDIVNWVIQHGDRNQYDIKVAIGESITYGHVHIVEMLFTTFGAEYFDLQKLSLSMCSQSSHKDVALFVLKTFDYNELDMTAIVKKACWDGWTEVVEFVLDKVPHDNIDWKEPLLNTCLSGESQISQLIIDNISHDKFDVRLAMIFVCRRGWEEIASLLLEKVDHSKFDFHEAITEANRFGETDIIKVIFQKVSFDILDVKAAVNLLCTTNTNENLILWILKQVNIALLDYDSIQEKAREHNWSRLEMKKML